MANLIISEFANIGGAAILVASQTLAIGAAPVASAPLNSRTATIRLFAEANCQVSIGDAPDAAAGDIIPLAADEAFILQVVERTQATIEVVERTVA